MSKVTELEQRLLAVEAEMKEIKARFPASMLDKSSVGWWINNAGRFQDDPVFAEIVRLGREYRESLRPGQKKKSKLKKKRANAGS